MAEPYRVEPAKSSRSACKVSKEPIEKGELRFGSFVDIGGHGSYHWRKLAYIAGSQVKNLESKMGGVDKIGGFDDLTAKQQVQLRKACKRACIAGAKKEKDKDKVAKAKEKAKVIKDKIKAAKAKAKAKALAAKEKAKLAKEAIAAKAKAKTTGKAKAVEQVAEEQEEKAPPIKKARIAVPEDVDPKLVGLANKAIDFAKDAKWSDLFAILNRHPEVVNIRPEPREYTILHQAAYHGSQFAVDNLIDKFGADPAKASKSGESVASVARGQGYGPLADSIMAR